MIRDQDRSGWIGASDTPFVMGSWSGKSFARFWRVKLGIDRDRFATTAMLAGTWFEHPILRHLGVERMDRQIRLRRLRLRVNLDGETPERIKEVKTCGRDYRISRNHWMQAQVEMFAAGKGLDIVAYRLEEEDYRNFFRPIDPDRLTVHPVDYDRAWVEGEYLPRLFYLARRLRRGEWPNEADWTEESVTDRKWRD